MNNGTVIAKFLDGPGVGCLHFYKSMATFEVRVFGNVSARTYMNQMVNPARANEIWANYRELGWQVVDMPKLSLTQLEEMLGQSVNDLDGVFRVP